MKRWEKKQLKILAAEHAFIISRHHGNLNEFETYIKKLKGLEAKEIILALQQNRIPGFKGLRCLEDHTIEKVLNDRIYKGRNKLSREQECAKYFYYRMVYSLLVACDYYATTEFTKDMKLQDIGKGCSIDKFQSAYEKSEILKMPFENMKGEQYSSAKDDSFQMKKNE